MSDMLRSSSHSKLSRQSWRHRIDSLKIRTCIASSWFALGLGAYYSLIPLAIPGKIAVGSLMAVGGYAAHKISCRRLSQQFKYNATLENRAETAPSDLIKLHKNLSEKIGLPKVGKIRLAYMGKDILNGHADIQKNIVYITRPFYRKLNHGERAFLTGHELAHIQHDHVHEQTLRDLPARLSAVLFPAMLTSCFAQAVQGTGPLWSLGLSYGGAAAISYFTKIMASKASHIAEFRADRTALEATNDPISALSHFSQEPFNPIPRFAVSDFLETHPSDWRRVLALIDAHNNNHPHQPLEITGLNFRTRAYAPLARADIYHVDARKYDGNIYKIDYWGFSPI